MGFIKSTDHRPLAHRLTDRRLTDPIIIFKRLGNIKIFILQTTNTAGKIISVYSVMSVYYVLSV